MVARCNCRKLEGCNGLGLHRWRPEGDGGRGLAAQNLLALLHLGVHGVAWDSMRSSARGVRDLGRLPGWGTPRGIGPAVRDALVEF